MDAEDQNAFFDLLSSHGGDCKYYSIDSFNDTFTNHPNSGLSVISFNIRSFHKNCDEFIGFLKNLKFSFDIIILTETWLSDANTNLCYLDGYDVVHSVRKAKAGGGVSMFIRDSLKFNINNNLCLNNDIFESVGITLNLNNENQLNILGIYRPPGGNLDLFSNSFFNVISENN